MVFVPGRVDCIFPGEFECRALHRNLGDEPDCDACKNPRPLPEVLTAWEVAETLVSVQGIGLSAWAMERFFPEIGEDTFRLAMRVVDIMFEKALKDAEMRRNK
jgi:hypothetical protein